MDKPVSRIAAIVLLGITIAGFLTAGCTRPRLETTTVSIGTDGESSSLVEGLINGYETTYPESVIVLSRSSRDQVLEGVSNGTLDSGIVLVPPTGESLFTTVIAADMLVFVVNTSNPIEGISSGDARSIFQGRIANWSQLDEPELFVEVATYPAGSSPRLALDTLLLLQGEMNPAAHLVTDPESMLLFVDSTQGSIGYVPNSSLNSTTKSIAVDGVRPTRQTAQNRTYPYIAQIVFVSTTEPQGRLRHFLDWTVSAQGQQVVRRYALGFND
jgi:ABC-type phosphate transport system substrate-binding protein